MPSTKSYRSLHDTVISREGATERLEALREETLAEIGLYELRRTLAKSQTDLAAALGITQSAVSQFENSDDLLLSSLRTYIEGLGARLQLVAVFDDGQQETAVPINISNN